MWSEWTRQPGFWPVCYFIIINIAGFAMMGIDKYKAKHERWAARWGCSAGCGYSTTRRCTIYSVGACRPSWRYRQRWRRTLLG